MDRLLTRRGIDWPTRETFIQTNFRPMVEAGSNPITCSFIDGSVLNNKPFAEAIGALFASLRQAVLGTSWATRPRRRYALETRRAAC